jgi:hypothetical protein
VCARGAVLQGTVVLVEGGGGGATSEAGEGADGRMVSAN